MGEASPGDKSDFVSRSSSVVHVPGVNDIQSSSSTGQNMSQISRQLNQSQVAWTGSRPPFPGQVRASVRALPRVPGCWEPPALGHAQPPVVAMRRVSTVESAEPSAPRAPLTAGLGAGSTRPAPETRGPSPAVPGPTHVGPIPGSCPVGQEGHGESPSATGVAATHLGPAGDTALLSALS